MAHDSPVGRVTDAFLSNGRSFAVRQTHWLKIAPGAIAEHDAIRDDLGMAKQLGWIPPRPRAGKHPLPNIGAFSLQTTAATSFMSFIFSPLKHRLPTR